MHSSLGSLSPRSRSSQRRHVAAGQEDSQLTAFTLSQVLKCLYPTIPDYVPSVAQTGALVVVSFLAAYVVDDQSLSFGQSTYDNKKVTATAEKRTLPARPQSTGSAAPPEIPVDLQDVVDRVTWVLAKTNGGVTSVDRELEK